MSKEIVTIRRTTNCTSICVDDNTVSVIQNRPAKPMLHMENEVIKQTVVASLTNAEIDVLIMALQHSKL